MKYLLFILTFLLITFMSGCIQIPGPDDDNEQEAFTEFYLLGPEKRAENYPQSVERYSLQTLYVGVSNMEGEEMSYTIEISLNSSSESEEVNNLENLIISNTSIPSFSFDIDDGVSMEYLCTFWIVEVGDLSMNFRLKKDDLIHREIFLNIEVN